MTGRISQFPLEEEYRKKHHITAQDISKLRSWVATQPHLPADCITDLDLILTYHCCGRSPEVSKQVLDLNLTLRTLFTNLFRDRKFDARVETAMNTVLFLPLEMRSHDGYAAIYIHVLDPDVKKFNYCDCIRSVFMILDLWQYEEGTWPGFLILIDFEGVTLGHIAKLDLQTLQEFFYYLQEAMLVNLKGLHLVNAPSFIDRLLMLIKPFMKKHLLEMLEIHQVGSDTLEQFMPRAAFPKDVGGQYMSLVEAKEHMLSKMRANNQFFLEENKKRVVESRRPGKPKTITDIFGGVEGSFKKLEID